MTMFLFIFRYFHAFLLTFLFVKYFLRTALKYEILKLVVTPECKLIIIAPIIIKAKCIEHISC